MRLKTLDFGYVGHACNLGLCNFVFALWIRF